MKKVFSFILAAAMLICSASPALAEDSNTVVITTKAELIAAANAINADANVGEGKTYRLDADINLENEEWKTYIGSVSKPFKGTFDGNKHVIRNYFVKYHDTTNTVAYGLFGAIGGNAKIYNLGVENVKGLQYKNGWYNAFGAIAGQMFDNAQISECYAKNVYAGFADDYTADPGSTGNMRAAAAIAGRIDETATGVSVVNCYSLGVNIDQGQTDYDAGIIGYVGNGGAKVTNCYSDLTVARYISTADPANSITNCYYTGAAPWPWACSKGNNTSSDKYHGYVGTKVTTEELKGFASTLGDKYSNDNVLSPINGGLPVLTWEYDIPALQGAGTFANPYKIGTASDLTLIAAHGAATGKYFKMTADIDMENANWAAPIGNKNVPFEGNFDGDGHKISNITLAAPQYGEEFNLGLFGVIGGDAVILDLGMENVTVAPIGTWGYNTVVGAIAGKAVDNATVKRCYVKNMNLTDGNVEKYTLVMAGGLIGKVKGEGVSVSDCYSLGFNDVDSTAANASGLIGELLEYENVSNCYSDTSVSMTTASQVSKTTNSYAVTNEFGAYERVGTLVTAEELKGKAAALGEHYVENAEGYPMLKWETGYDYPDEEQNVPEVEISTAEDLKAIGTLESTENRSFKLVRDIDLGGAEWTPIGNKANPFKGKFNGNGHVVSNYKITVTSAPAGYIGLFGNVAGDAVITRLGVKNATIECATTEITGAGLLAGGLSERAKVTECFANSVTLSTVENGKIWQAGGLIGILDQQSTAVVVKDCYTTNIVISITSGDMNMDSGVVGGVRSDNVLVENIYCPSYAAIDWLGCDPYTGTTAYPNGHIVNVHFAGTMPWPWACAKGNNTSADKWYGYAGTKHDNSEDIKALATTLGENFIDDTDELNGGYPILAWQSEEDVVKIKTVEQLKNVASDTNSEGKKYRLMNDLDLDNTVWSTYIGTKSDPFKGEFDGNGHVIRNVKFNVVGGENNGIFGIVGGKAYIHDLGVENVYGALETAAWDTSAGAVAGYVTDTAEISRCFARNITWETKVGGGYFRNGGGLVGRMVGSGALIEYCYATNVTFVGDINMDSGLVGGLESNLDTIRNCYSDGAITDYLHAEECTKVVNAYTSLEAYPWPWACQYNSQASGKWYGYVGTQVSADELKGMASTLGSMFVADIAGDNGGYPKFAWEGKVVTISKKEELAAIANDSNTAKNTYILTNDIDFAGSDWSTPIGTEAAPFEGKFDGKGYAIKNVNYALKAGYFGIFGAIGGSSEIKNLGIENVTINNTAKVAAKVGGLAGLMKGKAKITETYARNVAFAGTATTDTSMSRAGGLVAVINGEGAAIQDSYATNVTFTNCDINYEGGIAGIISLGADKIINCYSDSTIVRYTNATAPGDVITNSYYAASRADGDLPWPWIYGVNTSGDGYIGTNKTKAELKGMASTLGSVFAADNAAEPINGGYPVFKREVTWANLSGAGKYNNPYLIKTVADLQELAVTEDTDGVYFRLENDIDMQGAQWTSFIGSEANPFKGNFNGNGHVIKNYKIIATKNDTGIEDPIRPFGLFGVIGGNAHVYNMGVEDIAVELEMYEWNNYFGGLAGLMVDSANVSGCYAKNVTFGTVSSWTPVSGSQNDGHFNSAAGLIGLINGDNCEMRHCYALDIGDGKVKAADGTDYHTIMFDAYLVGRGEKFAAFEHCYANGPMMQSKSGLYLKDCYETKHGAEWYTGYTWGAWTTDVWTLSDRWCNDFSPRGNNSELKHGPTLKWEQYPGYYQNLVTSGMMDANAATLNKIFGTIGATVEAGVANGFATGDILKLPAGQKISYTVPVEAGATYRISFDGASVSGSEQVFSFTFGGTDFAAALKKNTLGKTVDTKAVFYTAETDGDAVLEIGSDAAIYLDDIEVIKVDVPEEKYSIDANLRLDYHKIDVLESDLYVDDKISDGVEVNYTSKNGYIDGYGYLTDAVPVGFGTVDEEFKATVNLGAEDVVKSMNLKVAKREPYNIENIGLVDANGNAIYDIAKAEKIGTVKVTVNSDKAAHLYAAVYKNNVLTDIKKVEIAADGNCVVNLAVNGADKAKVFVMEDGSAAPLALSEKTLDRMADDAQITLHTIGDSICATYTPEDALKGWGQMIGESLDANHVTVDNSLAQGGMTAINFISNGRYEQLLNKLKAGDYVVVQLTHNDQYVVTKHEFRALISQFVYGARQKGATCVFVTSPETSTSATDTFSGGEYVVNPKINNSGYPDVLRTMADELGIPLVDINEMTIDYMKANGYSALIASGMWSTDTVHFSATGARWIASNIAKGMKDLGLPIGAFVTAQ